MTAAAVLQLARECGFELAGIARAESTPDLPRYTNWLQNGRAGEMRYMTDHRAQVRRDPRNLLPTARSIICVGKLYNTKAPNTAPPGHGWISRYAWGAADYHDVLREALHQLVEKLTATAGKFDHKICVDTAPLLERSYAREAGLGWIGKNTCLINQEKGSWFFLGEILTSLELEPDTPPPDRCGTCTRCIDACPTQAIMPEGLDATRCIAYLTIEKRGPIPEDLHAAIGNHVFGCDICQDVCPWNNAAPVTEDPAFTPKNFAPPLAILTPEEFQETFRGTPVTRARYTGFIRNIQIARANVHWPKTTTTSNPLDEPAAEESTT